MSHKSPWNEVWVEEGWFWQSSEPDERFYGRLENTPPDGPGLHLVSTNLLAHGQPSGPVDVLFGEALSGTRLSVHGRRNANHRCLVRHALGRGAGRQATFCANQFAGRPVAGTATALFDSSGKGAAVVTVGDSDRTAIAVVCI